MILSPNLYYFIPYIFSVLGLQVCPGSLVFLMLVTIVRAFCMSGQLSTNRALVLVSITAQS